MGLLTFPSTVTDFPLAIERYPLRPTYVLSLLGRLGGMEFRAFPELEPNGWWVDGFGDDGSGGVIGINMTLPLSERRVTFFHECVEALYEAQISRSRGKLYRRLHPEWEEQPDERGAFQAVYRYLESHIDTASYKFIAEHRAFADTLYDRLEAGAGDDGILGFGELGRIVERFRREGVFPSTRLGPAHPLLLTRRGE